MSYHAPLGSASEEPAAVCPNCGETLPTDVPKFCPACGWAIAGQPQPDGTVSCPVCWSPNPASNRFCESCAARLGLHRPAEKTASARRGIRWSYPGGIMTVGFIAGLAFFVVLTVMALTRDEEPVAAHPPPSTSAPTVEPSDTTAAPPGEPVVPQAVEPATVTASSELSDEFSAENLVDGNEQTQWRDDGLHGDGAVISLSFPEPVRVDAVVISGLPEDEAFHVSYRIRAYRLDVGDATAVIEGEIPDSPEPFRIELEGAVTSTVTLEVLSAYPGEPHGDQPAAEELAVAELEVIGVPAP